MAWEKVSATLDYWFEGAMQREKLHLLFKRNHGSTAKLAAELGIPTGTLSAWFTRGIVSARIESAVYKRAEDLLAEERLAEPVWSKRQEIIAAIAV